MIELNLPTSPSTNNLFATVAGRRRVKSQRYRTWLNAAGWDVKEAAPEPIRGEVDVSITFDRADRKDIDNGVKAILDLLVEHGLIDDDKHVVSLHVNRLALNDKRRCLVRVRPA